jgi:hypothetical protein
VSSCEEAGLPIDDLMAKAGLNQLVHARSVWDRLYGDAVRRIHKVRQKPQARQVLDELLPGVNIVNELGESPIYTQLQAPQLQSLPTITMSQSEISHNSLLPPSLQTLPGALIPQQPKDLQNVLHVKPPQLQVMSQPALMRPPQPPPVSMSQQTFAKQDLLGQLPHMAHMSATSMTSRQTTGHRHALGGLSLASPFIEAGWEQKDSHSRQSAHNFRQYGEARREFNSGEEESALQNRRKLGSNWSFRDDLPSKSLNASVSLPAMFASTENGDALAATTQMMHQITGGVRRKHPTAHKPVWHP